MQSYLVAVALAFFSFSIRAETIAQWNFNGTDAASAGNGTVSLLGGVTASFAGGSSTDTATNNYGWNTTSYPAQGSSNKTAGLEFRVSTEGYSEIVLSWEQRLSGSASKYSRVQYSVDGATFTDLPSGVLSAGVTTSFEPKSVAVPILEAENNPLFAFRIVTEFESTAVGTGTNGYVTTYGTNAYTRSGTVRFDVVKVSGTAIAGGNTAPTISSLPDRVLRVGESGGPWIVTLADHEDSAENLVVVGASSEPAVVDDVQVAGTAAERQVIVRAGAVPGEATVTLTVQDSGLRSASTTFKVTVLPLNTAPLISTVPGTNVLCGEVIGPLAFTVTDSENASLVVTASSSNPILVPNDAGHLVCSGSGTNRALTVIPAAGQWGAAAITLSVNDGSALSTTKFPVMVRPTREVVLCDSFSYEDGGVCSNSAGLWRNRSGIAGDCLVNGGGLELSGARSEDVTAGLADGPFTNGAVLYASFVFRFEGTPKVAPEYFAHFVGGSALRARIWAGATDVWPGAFRLYVSNGTDTNTIVPWNLTTNTAYRVVTRYDVATAQTTLWLEPREESDAGTLARDSVGAVSISGYGFRQDSGLGTKVRINDVRVGTSFKSVTSSTWPGGLSLRKEGENVIIYWDGSDSALEEADFLAGPFHEVSGATNPFTNHIDAGARFFRVRTN